MLRFCIHIESKAELGENAVACLNNTQSAILEAELAAIKSTRAILPEFTKHQVLDHIPSVGTMDQSAMRRLAQLQGVLIERHFTSHRKILGPLIVWVKKNINGLQNRFLHSALGRQVEFNHQMWHLAHQVQAQELRLSKIEEVLRNQGVLK